MIGELAKCQIAFFKKTLKIEDVDKRVKRSLNLKEN